MPKHSEEAKKKMRKAWESRRATFVPPMKGKTMTEESRAKMSAAAKSRKSNRLGKIHSDETKKKISAIVKERTPKGRDHPGWKHGARERNKDDRRKSEYTQWRTAVFERDGYRCQKCGDDRGGNLRAHHAQGFSSHPALRFDISNGITLCHSCHELEHYKPDSIRNVRKLKRGERLWS